MRAVSPSVSHVWVDNYGRDVRRGTSAGRIARIRDAKNGCLQIPGPPGDTAGATTRSVLTERARAPAAFVALGSKRAISARIAERYSSFISNLIVLRRVAVSGNSRCSD